MPRVWIRIFCSLRRFLSRIADKGLFNPGSHGRLCGREAPCTGGLNQRTGHPAPKDGLIGAHISSGKGDRTKIRDRIAVPAILAPGCHKIKGDFDAFPLNALWDIRCV